MKNNSKKVNAWFIVAFYVISTIISVTIYLLEDKYSVESIKDVFTNIFRKLIDKIKLVTKNVLGNESKEVEIHS